MSAWNEEATHVTNDRIERSSNPHHATTTATRHEDDGEDGELGIPCGLGRCYHRAHGMGCPPDPWAVEREVAA